MFYKVWSNADPNNMFEVEAQDDESAAMTALAEVGYSISATPTEEPEL